MRTDIIRIFKIFSFAAVVAAVAGCHSTPVRRPAYEPAPSSARSVSDNDQVWVPDQFKAYSVGRYIDPSDPAVMHDAHTLYRREQTGRWNLAPSESPAGPGYTAPSTRHDTVVLRDALTAELNRQRATSFALVEQARILDGHLRELNAESREFHDALKQLYSLRDQMAAVSNRVDSIQYHLDALAPAGKSP